jgi:hypothetical protein
VRRIAAVLAAVALTLGACRGKEETIVVPERVTNEQALRLVRACQVTRFLSLHSGELELTLEGGRTIFVIRPDTTALSRAAVNASLERGCEIAVGME